MPADIRFLGMIRETLMISPHDGFYALRVIRRADDALLPVYLLHAAGFLLAFGM